MTVACQNNLYFAHSNSIMKSFLLPYALPTWFQTSIYAPRGGVKDTGAVFSIVVRHTKTNQISSYHTQMYKPVKV